MKQPARATFFLLLISIMATNGTTTLGHTNTTVEAPYAGTWTDGLSEIEDTSSLITQNPLDVTSLGERYGVIAHEFGRENKNIGAVTAHGARNAEYYRAYAGGTGAARPGYRIFGTTSINAEISQVDTYNPVENFSFSFWFRIPGLIADTNTNMISLSEGPNTDWVIKLGNEGADVGKIGVQFVRNGGSSDTSTLFSSSRYDDALWHFAVFSWNSGTLSVRVDANEDTRAVSSAAPIAGNYSLKYATTAQNHRFEFHQGRLWNYMNPEKIEDLNCTPDTGNMNDLRTDIYFTQTSPGVWEAKDRVLPGGYTFSGTSVGMVVRFFCPDSKLTDVLPTKPASTVRPQVSFPAQDSGFLSDSDMGNFPSFAFEFRLRVPGDAPANSVVMALGRLGFVNDMEMYISIAADQALRVSLPRHDGSFGSDIASTTPLNDGVERHIMVAVDGNTNTGYLYIDGVLDGSSSIAPYIAKTENRLYLGRWPSAIGSRSQISGDVIYWSRLITPAESAMNVRRPGASDPSIALRYPVTEGSGLTLTPDPGAEYNIGATSIGTDPKWTGGIDTVSTYIGPSSALSSDIWELIYPAEGIESIVLELFSDDLVNPIFIGTVGAWKSTNPARSLETSFGRHNRNYKTSDAGLSYEGEKSSGVMVEASFEWEDEESAAVAALVNARRDEGRYAILLCYDEDDETYRLTKAAYGLPSISAIRQNGRTSPLRYSYKATIDSIRS